MPLTKTITVDTRHPVQTVYCVIQRVSDGYLMVAASGAFAAPSATPADNCQTMTEDLTIAGRYTLSESRTTWTDGDYEIIAYLKSGGTADPLHDGAVGGCDIMHIVSDAEVTDDAQIATAVWNKTLP